MYIEFHAFSTEFGSDFLFIYDGNVTHPRYSLSGNKVPPPFAFVETSSFSAGTLTLKSQVQKFLLTFLLQAGPSSNYPVDVAAILLSHILTLRLILPPLCGPIKFFPLDHLCLHYMQIPDPGILLVCFQHFLTAVKV